MLTLSGTGIGGGIVIGRARVLESRLIDVPRYRIDAAQTQFELERLDTAIAAVRGELAALASQLPKEAPAEVQA
ncbi:MAG TPA: phosphoenolpyruvate-utilizing N-terminal domain-containing protein, partial [Burkholderiaceae bacterium]|nr:phosphoenolpyruvate-utilizing N-terminal domain-containing protein [Burkholderiaceae bacterium]